jgi:hypothetical protein
MESKSLNCNFKQFCKQKYFVLNCEYSVANSSSVCNAATYLVLRHM